MNIKISLIFLFSIFFSFNSLAENKKTYIIGVEDYISYPYQTSVNGNYYGIYREILDEFAKSENIKFIYEPYKIKDLYTNLYTERIDFKFPDNPVWRSPQKEKFKIIYTDFLGHYIDAIFVRKEDLNKNLNELEKFGVAEDIILWTLINKNKEGKVNIVHAKNCAELLSMLERKEINGIFCNYSVMKYLLKDSALQNEIVINLDLPFIDNYYYISTISHPDIVKKFNIWISKNREFINKKINEFK